MKLTLGWGAGHFAENQHHHQSLSPFTKFSLEMLLFIFPPRKVVVRVSKLVSLPDAIEYGEIEN